MGRYVMRRLLALVPILLGVTFVSFALMHLAGSDYVTAMAENTGTAVSQEVLDARRAELGLDRPFLEQYASWLSGLARGDLGQSYVSGKDVSQALASRLPATLALAGVSMAATLVISVPLGVLAAVRRGRAADCAVRAVSFVGNALPNFVVALLLSYFFGVCLGWLPVLSTAAAGPAGVVLPAATLTVAMSAKYVRQVRAVVLDELGKPYVAGARSRGVPERTILVRSVLRCALPALVTLVALSVGDLLGGTAIVETIFMWDGVGKLAVDSIMLRDYPVVLAYVAWMALIYVVVNLAADLVCRKVSPAAAGGEGAVR